jgi:hypothetical protein
MGMTGSEHHADIPEAADSSVAFHFFPKFIVHPSSATPTPQIHPLLPSKSAPAN